MTKLAKRKRRWQVRRADSGVQTQVALSPEFIDQIADAVSQRIGEQAIAKKTRLGKP